MAVHAAGHVEVDFAVQLLALGHPLAAEGLDACRGVVAAFEGGAETRQGVLGFAYDYSIGVLLQVFQGAGDGAADHAAHTGRAAAVQLVAQEMPDPVGAAISATSEAGIRSFCISR